VIWTQITVFTDSFCIHCPLCVFAILGFFSPSFHMIAILAHTICIIIFIRMSTFWNVFSVLFKLALLHFFIIFQIIIIIVWIWL
jgi:hypothetical protein